MNLRLITPSSRRSKGYLFALLCAAAVMLSACANPAASPAPTASPIPTASPVPSPTASPVPTATASPAADFPRTLTDDEGTVVELATKPQGVVSLSPAFTEIVFALGAGDRLLGGTDYDDFPPEAIELPDVATFNGVVIERVVELDPDLVLAGGNNLTSDADVSRLRELGFAVLVTYPPTVADVLGDITLIGTALGEEEAAASLTAAMQQRIDEVTAAVAGLDRPRVFYEIGYQPEIYGPAADSFVADMVNLAGGDAITTSDPAVFSIALEQLVSADPEVIILGDAAYGICPASISDRAGWDVMTAVQNDAIRPVNDLVVTRPGPRLADGLALLALAIHPEAAITPPAENPPLCVAGP